MNGVQDHWVRDDAATLACSLRNLALQHLHLLLDVCLYDFYPLNDYVLKNSLPLVQIHLIEFVLFIESIVYIILYFLFVDMVLLAEHRVHIAGAHA